MKYWTTLACVLVCGSIASLSACGKRDGATPGATGKAPASATPAGGDGWPAGLETPEGAVCELMRALQHCDKRAFMETNFPAREAGEGWAVYAQVVQRGMSELDGPDCKQHVPTGIEALYKAEAGSEAANAEVRRLRIGERVAAVELVVNLPDAKTMNVRYFPVEVVPGRWRVLGYPQAFPALAEALVKGESKREPFPRGTSGAGK